jgi:hypothetical protein
MNSDPFTILLIDESEFTTDQVEFGEALKSTAENISGKYNFKKSCNYVKWICT